ncbi:hypothetical protein [Nitrosomonas sp. Nm34]|uniref:hypothetical protein n=1 Tax=Nitrosomonas sp. Nm34 TaxID=1881055 RepID=UPI0015872AFC|nr:hypothetical protein [Nitrosomonas sp. Nm34]
MRVVSLRAWPKTGGVVSLAIIVFFSRSTIESYERKKLLLSGVDDCSGSTLGS